MAKRRGRRQLWLLLAVFVYALLVGSGIAPNPLPAVWGWLTQERPLAPDLTWQDRLGSRPAAAAAAGDALAVDAGTSTQLRRRSSGVVIAPGSEEEELPASWVVVAGGPDDALVIISPRDGEGYEVRDPGTGAVLHTEERAVAVWGYRDAWLDLQCGDGRACQLRYHRLGQAGVGQPVWTTDLPGERSGMLGAHPELAGPRGAAPNRIHSRVSGPEPVPPLLGLTTTRRGADLVVVVRTSDGKILQELEQARGERIMVVGDRVVRSTMQRHGGVCVSSVTGYEAISGAPVWGPQPYHLWTTDDVGCEQREPPLSDGTAMAAVRPDGLPIVVDGYDGRVLWTGELDERVEDLSPELAVIRAADRTTRYAVRLGGDGEREWERTADPDAGVALAGCGVVVADRNPDRVYVWDPATGDTRLTRATSARVLACAPDGVVIADGRSIGFAPFDGAPAPPGQIPEPK
ncbi:MAG: hypothetical protein GEV12_09900 [Micromonosporaceae bacterium]|nr:hypothetical protein [Micromonosporaceae bacterium]